MILQNMTPKEKQKQMVTVYNTICAYAKMMASNVSFVKRIVRTKVFPTFYTEEHEIQGMGKWTFVFEAESKSSIRKGVFCCRAYQTYHVSHAKNPLNNGTGIYMMNSDDYGNIQCQEFPPHYFNRLRERYIAPKGIVQPDFPALVKRMLTLHHNSMDVVVKGYTVKMDEDGIYSMKRDNSVDRKDGYENLITYHKDGVSLGVSCEDKGYFNFTTFVPNSLLREGQADMQAEMMAELRGHELRKQTNPFATFDTHSWVSKDRDI